MARLLFLLSLIILVQLVIVHGLDDSSGETRLAEPPNEIDTAEEGGNEHDQYNAEAPEAVGNGTRRMGKHRHNSDKEEIAGGSVIIGGLVTTTFAAVLCYIRVTRKNNTAQAPVLKK